MIIEKMLVVAATSTISGGLIAEAIGSNNISTGLLGICVTILLFVVKELMGIKERISRLEQKMEDKK